jgi:hypothetical protein
MSQPHLFILLLTLLPLSSPQPCHNDFMVGELLLSDPSGTPSYIIQSGGTLNGSMTTTDNRLIIPHNFRSYLVNQCAPSFSAEIFKSFKLLDGSIRFTVDVSEVGCGCNAAVYLVTMPGYNVNQSAEATDCGDYYCDANRVCGVDCPEMDLLESNMYGLQIAPHNCTPIQGKYYPDCDKAGCGLNPNKLSPTAYGPGPTYTINTLLPFTVTISFPTTNQYLSSIHTLLSQNGKSFSFTHNETICGPGYLEGLTEAFRNGMVLTFSHWGSSGDVMAWLDVPPCDVTESCNTSRVAIVSQITIKETPKISGSLRFVFMKEVVMFFVGMFLLMFVFGI